jgi:hypothetical protein
VVGLSEKPKVSSLLGVVDGNAYGEAEGLEVGEDEASKLGEIVPFVVLHWHPQPENEMSKEREESSQSCRAVK